MEYVKQPEVLRIGVVTVSDRVSAGVMNDLGGPAVEQQLAAGGFHVSIRVLVPDDQAQIADALRHCADDEHCDVVFTTGGTGFSPRDVTPEATTDMCTRLVPGIAEAMRATGRVHTVFASLSRAVAGIRGETLIINLPGSPKGAAEGVQVVSPLLAHAVATLHGGRHPA